MRDKRFIRVSARDSRYLEYDDGSTYIPMGINLCFPRFARGEDEVMAYFRRNLTLLAEHGGNFVRIWLGSPFFELETRREGVYETEQLEHMAAVTELAGELGLRIKFTLEHFRRLEPGRQAEIFPGAASFVKEVYHRNRGGSFENTAEFMSTDAGHRLFLAKLDVLAKRFAQSPAVMGWELWNEVNCCGEPELWMKWTEAMLPELKRRFPRHLTMQSLGSFDSPRSEPGYRWLGGLPDNDCVQAHRYLDPGAEFEICHASLDLLSADAIRRLREYSPRGVLFLAEGGAVEFRHSKPSHLYKMDTAGSIMHDVLFAPFFAGAAGGGQIWHWEEYVIPNRLWHHLGHFRKALEGIDPAEEDFRPCYSGQSGLRLYILEGKHHTLAWCRDAGNDWEHELERGEAPVRLSGLTADVPHGNVLEAEWYSPWTGGQGVAEWRGNGFVLPDFERSLVLRINHREKTR